MEVLAGAPRLPGPCIQPGRVSHTGPLLWNLAGKLCSPTARVFESTDAIFSLTRLTSEFVSDWKRVIRNWWLLLPDMATRQQPQQQYQRIATISNTRQQRPARYWRRAWPAPESASAVGPYLQNSSKYIVDYSALCRGRMRWRGVPLPVCAAG